MNPGKSLLVSLLISAIVFTVYPASAQQRAVGNQDIPLLQHWLADQPEYAESISGVYETLQTALSTRNPRGELASPFHQLADDPAELSQVLNSHMDRFAAWQSAQSLTTNLVSLHGSFYATSQCATTALPLPGSLDEAAMQIESSAADIVDTFHHLLTEEQINFIRANHQLMMSLIQVYPYGGAFSEDNLLTLAEYADILSAADLSDMLCAGLSWSRFLAPAWQDNLYELMETHVNAESAVIAEYSTAYGKIFFGGRADHRLLSGNTLFIADIGGNDIYALRTQDAWSGLPQLILERSGNDIYDSLEPGGYAAGIGSISLLADFDGDDSYHANSQTQGTGIFGIGLLYDQQGDDEYFAEAMAQGFSLFGAGLLLDTEGNDRYQVTGLGQGVGMVSGLGILSDSAGDDHYLATGLVPTSYGTPGLSDSWSQGIGVGVRFTTPGGVGLLEDLDGQDDYNAGSFSQGGGYFLGLGMFRDAGTANDTYLGSRYNFGWGAHMGVSYFLEEGGNDYYRTRQNVAAGLSWDKSLVLFEDLAGNDRYDMGGFSLGASAHQAIGLFHDYGGSDKYRYILPARATQGPPSLSVFIDTGEEENEFEDGVNSGGCYSNNDIGFTLIIDQLEDADTLDCVTE